MKRNHLSLLSFGFISAGILILGTSVSAQNGPTTAAAPRYQSGVTTQPGVAGGVYEDVLIVQSVVSAIDAPSHKVTLTGSEGGQYLFTAGPDVKNLPQLHVGDKVTATFARRIAIIVRDDNAEAGASYASAVNSAVPGDKPGALFAEETRVNAKIKSLDTVKRTATLEYANGGTRTVPVRSDVDMSRYNVGDSVMTRVTTALTILTTGK